MLVIRLCRLVAVLLIATRFGHCEDHRGQALLQTAPDNPKEVYNFSPAEAQRETKAVLDRLKSDFQHTGSDLGGAERSKQAERRASPVDGHEEADADNAAEDEQASADRHRHSELRQLLALDESRRNIPAALEGYRSLAARLHESLERLRAEEESTGGDAPSSPAAEINTDLPDFGGDDPGLAPLADAAFDLAVLALTGLASGVLPVDEAAGLRGLQAAAEGGSLEADLALSHRHLQGAGVEQSCDLGFRYGRRAALRFVDEAEELGAFLPPTEPLLLRERWRNADFLMPPPAREGPADGPRGDGWDAAAEGPAGVNMLDFGHRDEFFDGDLGGWQWLQGFPVAMEHEPTLQMLQRLAAQGDGEALFNLGYMHLKGIEVPKNTTAAFFLFTAAMARKFPAAYNAVGVMFHNGVEVPRDPAAARRLFDAGAARGDADSMYNLGTMALAGEGGARDPEAALRHFEDANEHQHWRAPFQLAELHYHGEATERDCTEAMRHLNTFVVERATWHDDIVAAVQALDDGDEWKGLILMALVAEQGSTAGQHNLAFALETSKTFELPQRYALAYELYSRSGGSGYFAPGLTDAAKLIWNGHKFQLLQGTNRTRALELFEAASAQGDTEATFLLARAAEGRGGVAKRNVTRAAELYREAIRMAPSERFAAAPLLALFLLKLGVYQRCAARLFSGRNAAVAHWDLAVLSALTAGLASVLWLRWRRWRAPRPTPARSPG